MLTETDVLPVTEARILEIGREIGQSFRPQEMILLGSCACVGGRAVLVYLNASRRLLYGA